jgi:outer membrane lipoprotein LolB
MKQPLDYARVLLMGSLLLLAACSHQPRQPSTPINPEQQAALDRITHWAFSGKFAFRAPNDNGTATIEWRHADVSYHIQLSGPLGQKRTRIIGTPTTVRLEQAGVAPQEAATPEQLLEEQLGWTLPLTQLTYWVRGLPEPNKRVTASQLNEQGLLAHLQQGGWDIHYPRYSHLMAGNQRVWLPTKIEAAYGEIRLTLIIRQWQLDP